MADETEQRIDALIDQLIDLDSGDVPLLTATVDLRTGSGGQPPALQLLPQIAREAGEALGKLDRARTRSIEQDLDALRDAIEAASEDGALGLVYCGSAGAGILSLIETPYPLRNSAHAGSRARLFELVRLRYLAGRSVCLLIADMHTMDITRVRYAAEEASDSVDWPKHFLSKHGQRTSIEGAGGMEPGAGGHAVNKVERLVEHQRSLFAQEAARHVEAFVQPGDLLVLAGPEEARAQLLNQLPAQYRDVTAEMTALDPTREERELLTALTEFVAETQHQRADADAARWFDGGFGDLAISGTDAIVAAAEQGRVETLILHDDAIDHYGTMEDARLHEPPHDPEAVEALLQASIRQGAEVMFATDPRLQQEQHGAIAIARFALAAQD